MKKIELLEIIKTNKHDSCFTKCVSKALEYIKENYLSNVTLEDISRAVAYNKFYLCRIFKKETGYTIQSVVGMMRTEHAKQLLSTSKMSLTEVAYASGLSSQSYFCYLFKKIEGTTPYAYRSKHNKKRSAKT